MGGPAAAEACRIESGKWDGGLSCEGVCFAYGLLRGVALAATNLQRHEPSSPLGGMGALEFAEKPSLHSKAWMRDPGKVGSS